MERLQTSKTRRSTLEVPDHVPIKLESEEVPTVGSRNKLSGSRSKRLVSLGRRHGNVPRP